MLSLFVATNTNSQTVPPGDQVDFPTVLINSGTSISQLNPEQFSLNFPGIYRISIILPSSTGGTAAIVVDGNILTTGQAPANAEIVATTFVPPNLPPSLVEIVAQGNLQLNANVTIIIERLA